MKNRLLQYLFLPLLTIWVAGGLCAQDGSALPSQMEEEKKKVQFNGLGRASIQQTGIGGEIMDTDTATVENLSDGEFLLDLAVNAQPNDKNEVQAILRLRNEFGGFFGAGVAVEVRELWARGLIANVLKYRVGDMDVALTPYTLFLPDEEGKVNEPGLFRPQKEVIYYENFYTEDNRRRLQGGKLDFGLEFAKGLDDLDFTGFVARIRGTDFFTTPTRFLGGGHIGLASRPIGKSGAMAEVGLNLAYTWDDLKSGEANSGLRNSVYTLDFGLTLFDKDALGLRIMGETGQSNLEFKKDSLSEFKEDDTFLEIGAVLSLKEQRLSLSAAFVDVGPDFFSSGAQSRRVDLNRAKTYYNRIGNQQMLRMPTIFDLARDRALYTFQLSDRLMSYDPRYSNTQPYGKATPNRRGLRLGLDFMPENGALEASVDVSLLKELRGQGTKELKDFRLIRAMANLNVHKLADWEKALRLTLGFQNEQTTRGGLPVEEVDLSSNLVEAGVEAELFSRFDLLLGARLLSASGNEYIPLIEEFNDVKDFPAPYIADDAESLLGAGLRYRFNEGVYITLQYQSFDFSRKTDPGNDYQLNQFFVLYNMNF